MFYVDNLGALGPNAEYAIDAQRALAEAFSVANLDTHGEEVIVGNVDILGTTVDFDRKCNYANQPECTGFAKASDRCSGEIECKAGFLKS